MSGIRVSVPSPPQRLGHKRTKRTRALFRVRSCAATLLFFPGISLTTCRPVDRRCLPRTQPPADDATGGVFSRSRADLPRLFPEDIRTATGTVHPFRPLCIDPGRADKRPYRTPPSFPSGTTVHHPPVGRRLQQKDSAGRLKKVPVSFLSFSVLFALLSLFYSVLPFGVACNTLYRRRGYPLGCRRIGYRVKT